MFDPTLGEPIIEDIMEELSISRYDTLQLLHECEAIPGYVDGQLVATLLRKGTEVHFAISKAYRGKTINRRRTREFLQPVLDEHGFLTTRLLHDRKGQQRFIERIGFKKTWSDARFNYFMLTDLPFERKHNV